MRLVALSLILMISGIALAADPMPADNWVELLKSGSESPWRKIDKNWVMAQEVTVDDKKPTKLVPTGEGTLWVNGQLGRVENLITKDQYQDVEVHVEFYLGKNSNSGIKFQGVYEIQLRDTAKNQGELTGDDCGGIYPRADDKNGYKHIDKGVGPKVNAAKPAGEWQTLDVQFRSPRFDDKGEKVQNAKVVKATLNDKLIHENVELKTPTGTNWVKKEVATGPFLLQADHGPVAFRNVKIRKLPAE
jgi:hypothetical protein